MLRFGVARAVEPRRNKSTVIMSNPIADDLLKKVDAIKNILNRAPEAIGVIAVNHFKQNFERQGFVDDVKTPWQARKKDKGKDKGRAILRKSGRLANSLRVTRANTEEVAIGTDVPYARIHNEGGEIKQAARSELFIRNRYKRGVKKGKFAKGKKKGRGFTYTDRVIRMPKRQFLGNSKNLNYKIDNWYKVNISNALNIKP